MNSSAEGNSSSARIRSSSLPQIPIATIAILTVHAACSGAKNVPFGVLFCVRRAFIASAGKRMNAQEACHWIARVEALQGKRMRETEWHSRRTANSYQ
jgi:hypothetical protein